MRNKFVKVVCSFFPAVLIANMAFASQTHYYCPKKISCTGSKATFSCTGDANGVHWTTLAAFGGPTELSFFGAGAQPSDKRVICLYGTSLEQVVTLRPPLKMALVPATNGNWKPSNNKLVKKCVNVNPKNCPFVEDR